MNRLIGRVAFVEFQCAQILKGVMQLRVQVLPLAHSQVREELLAAEFAALVLRAQFFPLVVNRVPNVKQ